jgi:hypothetical protein
MVQEMLADMKAGSSLDFRNSCNLFDIRSSKESKGYLSTIIFYDRHGGAVMSYVNEAGWDRIVRVLLGLLLLYLGWGGVVGGALGVVLIILGVVFLVTGLIGFCPLYALFRVRTKRA